MIVVGHTILILVLSVIGGAIVAGLMGLLSTAVFGK